MRFHSTARLLQFILTATCMADYAYSIPSTPPSTPGSLHKRYEYGVSKERFIKRSTEHVVTTGIHVGKGPDGSLPQRLEIRELEKDKLMWTLYILGLDMLQWTPQTDKFSWYQIMGIHGRPFQPYDGAVAGPGGETHGYCSHVSSLLPTWHRPYLVFYEQVLHGLVQEIAAMFPEGEVRDNYTTAAEKFRIPYWDWAAPPPPGEDVFPESVGALPYVDADGPAGVQRIANPLFSYQFQPLDTKQLPNLPFTLYPQTMRYPDAVVGDATSQNHQVTTNMDKNSGVFRSRLYNLFTNYRDYSTFSNEAWIPESNMGEFDSLESIHDQVHGFTGGGGHMSYIDYSAFDPLFMLHHTMVDRCFAIWQVINPDSYVEPMPAQFASYTVPVGSIVDMHTPLQPFYNSSGGFWDSSSIRSTETFGYVYPETASNGTGIDKALVINAINRLYGPDTTDSELPIRADAQIRDTAHTYEYQEWIANILVRKHALSGPFFIHLFLGPIDPDPKNWSTSKSLIGSHCIFDRIDADERGLGCNCTGDLVTGTIPLTGALREVVRRGLEGAVEGEGNDGLNGGGLEGLKSLEREDVEPFLKRNLRFKLSFLNYTGVEAERVDSLRIKVVTARVVRGGEGRLPVWGGFVEVGGVGEG